MLQIGWGALVAQAGLDSVPIATQEHLDALARAAQELVVFSDETELEFIGPAPIWACMAISAALRNCLHTLLYAEPHGPTLRIF